MSTDSGLGQRILALRSRAGLSQHAVARRAGLDPSYLSRIENGRVRPKVGTAMKVAKALRVSANDLLGPSPTDGEGRRCPVSPSGHCMVELVQIHKSPASSEPPAFTPLQLKVLRKFAYLLQHRDPAVLKALDVLFGQLALKTDET